MIKKHAKVKWSERFYGSSTIFNLQETKMYKLVLVYFAHSKWRNDGTNNCIKDKKEKI